VDEVVRRLGSGVVEALERELHFTSVEIGSGRHPGSRGLLRDVVERSLFRLGVLAIGRRVPAHGDPIAGAAHVADEATRMREEGIRVERLLTGARDRRGLGSAVDIGEPREDLFLTRLVTRAEQAE
jgi:hypothetical protein